MTRAFIPYTPGSGGKHGASQYTDGADTKLDSVMVIGEQHLAEYTVNTAASTATANSHLLQVMAGASLRVRIHKIIIRQRVFATTAANMEIDIVRLTTAGTGGTARGTVALDPASSASGATAINLPGVKGTEGAVIDICPYDMAQVYPRTLDYVFDFDLLRGQPLTIAAGTANGIAVKNVDAIAAGNVFVSVYFSEAPY